MTVTVRNLNDGINALNIAEAGLSALGEITTRIKELAQQSANGSVSSVQRSALNKEVTGLVKEYNRVVATVSYNGRSLLNTGGEKISLQAGAGAITIDPVTSLSATTGDGTFGPRTAVAAPGNAVGTRLEDLNGDGYLDLAFGLNAGDGFGVKLNNGNGTFGALTNYTIGSTAVGFALGDFNNDGIKDAITSDFGGALHVSLGNGDGTFQGAVNLGYGVGGGGVGLEVGDFDKDGNLDIAGMGGALAVRFGDGNGGFATLKTIATGVFRQLQIIDFDNDGNLDIVTAGSGTPVHIARGDGNRNFSVETVTVAHTNGGIAVGDFNGDGRNDFAVSNILGGANGQVQTYYQQADKSFVLNQTLGASLNAQKLGISDFNGDGIPDLISTNTTNGSVLIMTGSESGQFTTHTLTAVGLTNSVAIGDINNDGANDLLIRESGTSLASFLGDTKTSTGLQKLSILNQAEARATLSVADSTLERISNSRSTVAAASSRIESAISVLQSTINNTVSAASRITSIDVATEVAKATRLNILQNITSSILAQANQGAEQALQLLAPGLRSTHSASTVGVSKGLSLKR